LEFFLFIAFAAVVVGLIWLSRHQANMRRVELGNWATARGLSFSPDHDASIDNRYPSFSCLAQGDGRYAYNIMQGDDRGRPVLAFDYHYATHSTDSKGHRTTYHHQFSAVIVSTGLPLKPLSIQTENLFHKIGAFFGFEDINFESAEFSRTFRVTSPDRRWAFDVLPQDTMEFLLAAPRFALGMGDRSVIAYRGGVFSTADFESALDVIAGLLDRIPQGVLDELKGACE